jgi:hypothetical protein
MMAEIYKNGPIRYTELPITVIYVFLSLVFHSNLLTAKSVFCDVAVVELWSLILLKHILVEL